MKWYTEVDDNENTTHLANSVWHDDGVNFTYRLVPVRWQNKVFWVEAHDIELRGDLSKSFKNVASAKRYVENLEKKLLTEHKRGKALAKKLKTKAKK